MKSEIRNPKSAIGFTLVELLVVVAIIVVLLAMLVPALDKAMKATKTAICLTNCKAWSTAMAMYSLENKGKVVYLGAGGRGEYWYDRLSPFIGEPNYDRPQGAAAGLLKANYCQETSLIVNGGSFGSARLTWNSSTAQGSYGWNLWVASNYYGGYDALGNRVYDPNFPAEDFVKNYSRAPGEMPIMGDSNWIGSWPDDDDHIPGDFEYPYSPHERRFFMSRFSVARHDFSINTSFVDGSASNVKLWKLWALKWHLNFKGAERDPKDFK